MLVLVTGGTGTLGSAFAEQAREEGHDVRIMSRQPRPEGHASSEWAQADLSTGDGIGAALDGVDAVLHAATQPGFGSREVDVRGTERLLAAARAAEVEHVLYPSIVGIEDIPLRYYQLKLEAEARVEASDLPYTTLRATQFHELIDSLFSALAWVPFVLPLPAGVQMQSVAAREVADALVRCLDEGPQGRLADMGGPQVMTLEEMADPWLHARGLDRRVLPLSLPGRTAAAFRAGKNTAPDRKTGSQTWQDWLQEAY